MPTLFILNGWKIQLFALEREAPHLHVDAAGEIFRFYLDSLEQMDTDLRRAPAGMARKIREWGEVNRTALDLAYADLSAGRVPDKTLFR